MTTVTINSSITLPATFLANYSATRTAMSSYSWAGLNLTATVVNGTAQPFSGRCLKIYYAFSNTDLGSTPDVTTLNPLGCFTIISSSTASATITATSDTINVGGNYLYTWLNANESLGAPVTFSLTAVQSFSSAAVVNGVSAMMADVNTNLGNSNTRFTQDLGWQFYNSTTGKWHTLLCVDSSPSAGWDAGSN